MLDYRGCWIVNLEVVGLLIIMDNFMCVSG